MQVFLNSNYSTPGKRKANAMST